MTKMVIWGPWKEWADVAQPEGNQIFQHFVFFDQPNFADAPWEQIWDKYVADCQKELDKRHLALGKIEGVNHEVLERDVMRYELLGTLSNPDNADLFMPHTRQLYKCMESCIGKISSVNGTTRFLPDPR